MQYKFISLSKNEDNLSQQSSHLWWNKNSNQDPTVKPDNNVNNKALLNEVDNKIDGLMSIHNESLKLSNDWDDKLYSFENSMVMMTNN